MSGFGTTYASYGSQAEDLPHGLPRDGDRPADEAPRSVTGIVAEPASSSLATCVYPAPPSPTVCGVRCAPTAPSNRCGVLVVGLGPIETTEAEDPMTVATAIAAPDEPEPGCLCRQGRPNPVCPARRHVAHVIPVSSRDASRSIPPVTAPMFTRTLPVPDLPSIAIEGFSPYPTGRLTRLFQWLGIHASDEQSERFGRVSDEFDAMDEYRRRHMAHPLDGSLRDGTEYAGAVETRLRGPDAPLWVWPKRTVRHDGCRCDTATLPESQSGAAPCSSCVCFDVPVTSAP